MLQLGTYLNYNFFLIPKLEQTAQNRLTFTQMLVLEIVISTGLLPCVHNTPTECNVLKVLTTQPKKKIIVK